MRQGPSWFWIEWKQIWCEHHWHWDWADWVCCWCEKHVDKQPTSGTDLFGVCERSAE